MSGAWPVGSFVLPGAAAAIAALNNNSFWPGVQLSLLPIDSNCSPHTALVHGLGPVCTQGEADDTVAIAPIVIADGCSLVAEPLARTYGALGYPTVSWGATSPVMSDKQEFPFFTRVVPPKTMQAEAWASIADDQGWDWVGLLATVQAVHSTTASAFQRQYSQLRPRGTIVSDLLLSVDLAEAEAVGVLRRMRDRGVRVFFVSCYVSTATTLLRVAADLDMLTDYYVWIGSDSWAQFEQVLPPSLGSGIVVGTEYGVDDEVSIRFFGELTDAPTAVVSARRIWTMTAYDAVTLVAKTLRNLAPEGGTTASSQLPAPGRSLLDALYRTAANTVGVTGPLTLTETGDRRGSTVFVHWTADALGVRRLRKIVTFDPDAPHEVADTAWPWSDAPDEDTLGVPPSLSTLSTGVDALVSVVLPLVTLLAGAVTAWFFWAERARNRMLRLVRGATVPSSSARIFATGCEFIMDVRLASTRETIESASLKAGTDLPILVYPPQLPALDGAKSTSMSLPSARHGSVTSSTTASKTSASQARSTASTASSAARGSTSPPPTAPSSSSFSASASSAISPPDEPADSDSASSASSDHMWTTLSDAASESASPGRRPRGKQRRGRQGDRAVESERALHDGLSPMRFSPNGAGLHDGVLEVVWLSGGTDDVDFVLVWANDVPVVRVGPAPGTHVGVVRIEASISRFSSELTVQSWRCGELAAQKQVHLGLWSESPRQRVALGATVISMVWQSLAPYPVDVAKHEALGLRRLPLDVPCRVVLRVRNNSTVLQAVRWPPTRRGVDYTLSPSTSSTVTVVRPGETGLLEGTLAVHASGLYALTIGILVHQLGASSLQHGAHMLSDDSTSDGAVTVSQLFVNLQFVTESTSRIASHCVEFGVWDGQVRSVALTNDVDLHREVELWRAASASLDASKLAPLLGYVLDVGVAALLVRTHPKDASLVRLDSGLCLSSPAIRLAVASALTVGRTLRKCNIVHGGLGLLASWSIDAKTGALRLLDIRDRELLNFERCLLDPLAIAPELVFAQRAGAIAASEATALSFESMVAPPERLDTLAQSPSVADLRAALTGPRKMSATLRHGDEAGLNSLIGSLQQSPQRQQNRHARAEPNEATDAWGLATLLWRVTSTASDRRAWSAQEAPYPWTVSERLLAGERPALPSTLRSSAPMDVQWSDAVASRIQRWWAPMPRMREPLP